MNNTTKVTIEKLPHGANLPLPSYATALSAGLDLMAAIENEIIIPAKKYVKVSTGIAIALPEGFEAQIRPRSGLAAKNGVTVLNSPGTIDADYRGEIQVLLINHGDENFVVTPGMRIAQMVIAKFEKVEFIAASLSDHATERGSGGFGSTGV